MHKIGRLVQRSRLCLVAICLLCSNSAAELHGQKAEKSDIQSSKEWPGFLGPNRDSKSTETGILTDWSGGKLQTVWETEVGLGYVLGSVSDGRFFQFDADENVCRLICRDAKSGKELWKHTYEFEYKDLYGFDNGPRATPLVDGDKVYAYGVAGALHCLDAKTGDLVWKANLNKQFGVVQNFFGVGSSPLIVGKHLLVMVGGSPEEDQAKNGKRLDGVSANGTAVVVLDKLTGNVIRKFGDDLASYSSLQTYVDDGKTFGIAWLRENLIGYDFEEGKVLWSFPYRARKYETVNASTPVVDGTKIFVSESYGPGSLLLEVGGDQPEVIWRDKDRRNRSLALHWNTPVLHEGYLYASHGESSGNAELRCVEFATGLVKWKQKGYGRSSVTLVDGKLVVLAEKGQLVLVNANPEKFELVTKYEADGAEGLPLKQPCWAAPVISDGMLYVRGKEKLLCLKLIP